MRGPLGSRKNKKSLRRERPLTGRRGWVRLREKGGKEYETPCHHKLEKYLNEYIEESGIAGEKDAPLFRTTGRFTGIAHRLAQPNAYRMIRRRTQRAGIKTQIGNHSLRATGSPTTLKNQGTLELAQAMANHFSPRTSKLYDRRDDKLTLNEYGKGGICRLRLGLCYVKAYY